MATVEELVSEFERVNASLGGGATTAAAAPPATPPAAALPPPFPKGTAAATLVVPNQLAMRDAPSIHIAGLDWPIPLLAPRQNRHVVPAVSRVTRRMRDTAEARLAELSPEAKAQMLQFADPGEVEQKGADAVLRQRIWKLTDFSFEMAQTLECEFFDTIADALYWSLTRAHPQLTRQQFDDMPIGMLEMIDAIGVVAQQTGMMKRADPSAAPLAAPAAAANPASPTSTP